MKKNQSCNALKVLKIIRIILSIILLAWCLSLSIIGHCASDQDYFPMHQNEGGGFSPDNLAIIENYFDTENNYLVMYKSAQFSDGVGYTYALSPKEHGCFYGEKNNDLIHFSLYYVGDNTGVVVGRLDITYSGQVYNTVFGSNVVTGGFYNLVSSNYDNSLSYVSNYQIYTNNNPDTRKIVLLYDDGETIPENDVAREDMEKPDISDYIPDWTNTPTFDNSSVESALQSVYNGVVWLGSNIKDTITGTGEYIADTVRWSIQKILNTIRDVFTAIQGKINEVKNAILTVVDKIQDTFDYISQSYDSTKINTAFNNMAIKTDYNNLTTLVNNAFSVFDSTAEPNTFQIPIHLERIPILHVNTVQYIDLGWMYDSRGLIRAFLWCITTFGLLYTIIDSLPNYLSGNDE